MADETNTEHDTHLIWSVYAEIGDYERHFNTLQQQYRLLASTWLLAMFGGVGFLLKEDGMAGGTPFLICAVGLAGAIGITQLWNLDLRLYHQLLNACMTQGLILEERNHWLPQLRHTMIHARNLSTGTMKNGFSQRAAWFYVSGVLAGLTIAIFGGVSGLETNPQRWMAIGMALLVAAFWAYAMILKTESPVLNEELARRLECHGEEKL